MYTKAAVGGHPIHPMLVAFPVAMYTATVVALIVFAGTHDAFWYHAAFWTNLSGIVMAAVAAIPGLVDLITLPRNSRAQRTGLFHAGCNVVALVLFLISDIVIGRSWYGHTGVLALAGPLVLTIVGLLVTIAAGWLGWTLVQTHHVGVIPTAHVATGRAPAEVDDLDELQIPPVTAPVPEQHIPFH